MDKPMRVFGMGLALAGNLLWGGVAPLAVGAGAMRPQAPLFNGPAIVRTALRYVGTRYSVRGTRPRTGFSNAGFVRYVYAQHGIQLPQGMGALRSVAHRRHLAGLQPGHLVFFANVNVSYTPPQYQAGIYIGRGQFVHVEGAPHEYSPGVVRTYFFGDPADGDYWAEHYDGKVRRTMIPSGPGGPPTPSRTPTVCMKWNPRDCRP